MPSKIPPKSPGPSSTIRGSSVLSTGSPTKSPEVSSYTWMKAVSLSSLIISPIRPRLPTRTMSFIFAPVMPPAITAGPEILIILPLIIIPLLLYLDMVANSVPYHVLDIGIAPLITVLTPLHVEWQWYYQGNATFFYEAFCALVKRVYVGLIYDDYAAILAPQGLHKAILDLCGGVGNPGLYP